MKTMTRINFTGNIEDIKKQIEQSVATFELLGNRSSVNFEQWFERWESGFVDAIENRNLGNYPLTGENVWRSDTSKRPRWRQWSNNNGIIEGEYWRDRSNDADSIPLSGTAEQLIQHIIQLEYIEKNEIQENSTTSDIIRYSGIPEISLYFRGYNENSPTKNKMVKGLKTFRFMGYTDNPKAIETRQDLKLIDQSDINQIGTKIKSIFGTTPPYIWSKGKKQYIYHDWQRGYNLDVYSSTYTEGERLVKAILAIRDLEINETFVKYKEPKNPTKAYPPSEEIQVLGEKFNTSERLPNIDVTFQYGKIYLPTIKKSKVLA
jgi:hypothetical protein